MIKKIIGVTVGTPISPSKIADELKPVKTVNGKEPDANGNVEVVGNNGKDGVSVTHSWNGTKLTVTSASGTSSADLKGAKGDTGPQGLKGDTGATGAQGPKGDTGATGAQGPKGDTGSQGPKGAAGADGKSAYAFAQDGGYAGTESEFAKSLAGIPNWDEEDAYIANDSIVISEQTISSGMWSKRQMDIQLEIPYAVYINGTVYFCIAGEEDGGYYLGNPTLFYSKSTQPHNNEPFCIYCAGGTAISGFFYKDDTLSYPLTLKVNSATVTTEKKLPKSYLPDDVALKSDIPEGGSGANIDVVASVGQTIVVEEVDADGKPTKWKAADYQPRTHWSEEGKVQVSVLPKYKSWMNSEYGFFAFVITFNEYVESYPLTSIYSIEYDGIEYKNLATVELQGSRFFGNLYFLNALFGTSFENTGEPFLLTGDSTGMMMFTLDQQETVHTLQIYIDGTEHHKIDVCYMPKIPVVDLTHYYTDIEFEKSLTITGDDYFEKVYKLLQKNEIVRIVYRTSNGGSIVTGCGFPMRGQGNDIYVHCIGNQKGCMNLNVHATPYSATIKVVQ